MSDKPDERQVETCGTFLREDFGLAREEVLDAVAERAVELLEETGLLPRPSADRERAMRFELRNLHRSAIVIRRIAPALGLSGKEDDDEK